MRRIFLLLSTFLLSLAPSGLWADAASRLSVPSGFKVEVHAEDLGDPRGLALSPDGDLHVCDRKGGRILRLVERKGKPLLVQTLVEGLHKPHSLAFHEGRLYVGETDRVSSFRRSSRRLVRDDGHAVVELPGGGGHYTRTILFGPDGKLYISIGSTCNVCEEGDERRATICRANPDGTGFEIFARGLRNAVGMAFRPGTKELFATCHGRDWLGDDLPPEIVVKVEKGKHYGWPYSYSLRGRVIPDPDLGKKGVRQTGLPIFEYQAHTAPLGITFYKGNVFPARYRQGFFMALHGSWNRTVPAGYKVVFVPYADGRAGAAFDFLGGFLQGVERIGRPVDILTGSKGELFVSDDHGGRIFRVTYQGPQTSR